MHRLFVVLLMGLVVPVGDGLYAAQTPPERSALKITPPEDRGYLRHPLRIMNRSTYDAYQLDPTKDESAIISYSVSKTGWVRVRLVRRDNKDIVLRTIQQWTESHYDKKRKYQIEWDGKDASGNRIDPREMFVLFEARDSKNGGIHKAHSGRDCKDPELTVTTLNKADATGGELALVATLEEPPNTSSHLSEYEARVYLDGKLIDTLRFPASSRTFTYRVEPGILIKADHTITLNLDDFQDHIGTASIHLQGSGHTALTAPRQPGPGTKAQAAPSFSLQDILGQQRSLAEQRGQVVLINFWATSCAPCIHEMPSLETLHHSLKHKGFVVLAIAGDVAGARTVKPIVDRLRLTLPILLDPQAKIAGLYGVSMRPTSYLIDRQGFLVSRIVGVRDWMSDDQLASIRALLPPSPHQLERSKSINRPTTGTTQH